MVLGSVCTKYQVCIVFRLARRSRTTHNQQTYIASENRNILDRLSPNVDFENNSNIIILAEDTTTTEDIPATTTLGAEPEPNANCMCQPSTSSERSIEVIANTMAEEEFFYVESVSTSGRQPRMDPASAELTSQPSNDEIRLSESDVVTPGK